MDKPVPHRPSAGRRGLDRIRFALERLVLRGLRCRLLLAASIVAAVVVKRGGIQGEAHSESLGVSRPLRVVGPEPGAVR